MSSNSTVAIETAAVHHGATTTRPRQVAAWLLVCCALVFAMVVLGGVTRLTGSGLSIVDWDPIMGVVPPLSEADWNHTFQKYQQFPEYQKKNLGMTLPEFKEIFWFEYAHRLLGRLIGVVFLVPFLYFLVKRHFDRSMTPKLIAMFALGGLQGLMGWYMVKSGLVDQPHVSQYRLTAHLALALIIYGYMLWVALGLLFPQRTERDPRLFRWSAALSGYTFLVALSGGFVAGLKAGLAYNTFPLMNGRWVPEGYWRLEPAWLNWFENIAAVQFNHRLLAMLLFASVVAMWVALVRRARTPRLRLGAHLLLAMGVVQVTLGISTLLLQVPVALGAAHQAGALVLFTAALYVTQAARTASD